MLISVSYINLFKTFNIIVHLGIKYIIFIKIYSKNKIKKISKKLLILFIFFDIILYIIKKRQKCIKIDKKFGGYINVSNMKEDSALKNALRECRDKEGYDRIDSIFENLGYKDETIENKTQALWGFMGMREGVGSASLDSETIYALAKDLLASGEWVDYVK